MYYPSYNFFQDPKDPKDPKDRRIRRIRRIEGSEGGAIYLARKREFVNYSISSIKDLNKLIVHLEKYSLLTKKAGDFFLFKQIINLMNNKADLTVEGLNQIVNLKASMN